MSRESIPHISSLSVLLDRPVLRGWQLEALRLAAEEVDVRLFTVELPAGQEPEAPGALQRAFGWLDYLRTSPGFRRSCHPSEVGLPWMMLQDQSIRSALDTAVAECDVLLDLTGDADRIKSILSSIPPFGVWAFESAGAPLRDGKGVGFNPLARGSPIGEISLTALDAMDRAFRCWKAEVRAHETSPALTEERMLTAAVPVLMEALRKVGRAGSLGAGSTRLENRRSDTSAFRSKGKIRRVIARCAWKTLTNQLERTRGKQWSIAVAQSEKFPPSTEDLENASWFDPGPGRSLVDPFILRRDGETCVFVEEFPHDIRKGHISVMTLEDDGSLSPPNRVLETPHHLSFPFVFEHEGRAYLLPEQSTRGDVVLYGEVDFPNEWAEERILLAGFPGVDPVLHFDGRRWWLFVSYGSHGNSDNNLFLFHSESLTGKFVAHAKNPVKLGIDGSRMAGGLMERDGILYRPAQDCTASYGGSIVFHRIEELGTEAFRETKIGKVTPPNGPFSQAFHTYSQSGRINVFDGLRRLTRRSMRSFRLEAEGD